jgi:hypothetical protein
VARDLVSNAMLKPFQPSFGACGALLGVAWRVTRRRHYGQRIRLLAPSRGTVHAVKGPGGYHRFSNW